MSHTPGPWMWYVSPLGMVIQTSDGSEMIAKINGNNFDNALLIAAAPELLSMLKELLQAARNGGWTNTQLENRVEEIMAKAGEKGGDA